MTVYVLVHDSIYEYNQEIDVDVYASFDEAWDAMNRSVDAFESYEHSDATDMIESRSTSSVCFFEEGRYSENHEAWEIFKREIPQT